MREVVEPDRLVAVPEWARVSGGANRSRSVVSEQREEASETHCAMIRKTRRGECVVCRARSRDLRDDDASESAG